MVNVKLGTNTQRKQVIANTTDTINQLFVDNGISTTGAIIYLDGDIVAAGCTLGDCGVVDGEEVMLVAVVKAESAAKKKKGCCK